MPATQFQNQVGLIFQHQCEQLCDLHSSEIALVSHSVVKVEQPLFAGRQRKPLIPIRRSWRHHSTARLNSPRQMPRPLGM